MSVRQLDLGSFMPRKVDLGGYAGSRVSMAAATVGAIPKKAYCDGCANGTGCAGSSKSPASAAWAASSATTSLRASAVAQQSAPRPLQPVSPGLPTRVLVQPQFVVIQTPTRSPLASESRTTKNASGPAPRPVYRARLVEDEHDQGASGGGQTSAGQSTTGQSNQSNGTTAGGSGSQGQSTAGCMERVYALVNECIANGDAIKGSRDTPERRRRVQACGDRHQAEANACFHLAAVRRLTGLKARLRGYIAETAKGSGGSYGTGDPVADALAGRDAEHPDGQTGGEGSAGDSPGYPCDIQIGFLDGLRDPEDEFRTCGADVGARELCESRVGTHNSRGWPLVLSACSNSGTAYECHYCPIRRSSSRGPES